jgi:coenzyme F420-reducing hydrogenase delta subunit
VGDCHFLEGNLRAMERVAYTKTLLDEVGLGGGRIEMYHIGASDAPLWAERVLEFTEKIKRLGPNPLIEVRRKNIRPVEGATGESLEKSL